MFENANPARRSVRQLDVALALKSAQVVLRAVRRANREAIHDVSQSGRVALGGDVLDDEIEDGALAIGEAFHGRSRSARLSNRYPRRLSRRIMLLSAAKPRLALAKLALRTISGSSPCAKSDRIHGPN